MSTENPLEVFMRECPDVQKKYAEFINSLIGLKGLDAKTKQLIYIGMKIVADDEKAVKAHVQMAKNTGASREEILETVVLSLSVTGLKGVTKFLPDVLELYDAR